MYRKELRDYKPVEIEITKSMKQEILVVKPEACDFSHVRFTSYKRRICSFYADSLFFDFKFCKYYLSLLIDIIEKIFQQTRFARGFSGGLVIPQLNKSVE